MGLRCERDDLTLTLNVQKSRSKFPILQKTEKSPEIMLPPVTIRQERVQPPTFVPGLCEECQRVHEPDSCAGHTKDAGMPCRRTTLRGERYCSHHARERGAGARPRKDLERLAARAAVAVPQFVPGPRDIPSVPGVIYNPARPPVENPVQELAEMAGILKGAFLAAGERVNELTSVGVETRAGGEQLRAEIQLWERLTGHLRALLVDMSKLNLEERLVRLEERKADMVAEGLFWLQSAMVAQLQLDRRQRDLTEALVRQTVQRIVAMTDSPLSPEG